MIHIRIDETLPELEIDFQQGILISAAEAVLRFANASPSADLSIVITSHEQIRHLNRQYLGVDAVTDVLSFPAEEIDPETGNLYLGDVLIAYPYVKEQAKAAGHPPEEELQLLVVHGVLHLLGYDHADDEGRTQMWEAQAQVFQRLRLPNDILPK